jgi:hypothetical protein
MRSHWLTLRNETIVAKGKGALTTYWLESKSDSNGDKSSRASEGSDRFDSNIEERTDRLVDWTADALYGILKEIVGNREVIVLRDDYANTKEMNTATSPKPFYEVKEIVVLPRTNKLEYRQGACKGKVSSEVLYQLRKYVSDIACLYKKNAFHNFEHVSDRILNEK